MIDHTLSFIDNTLNDFFRIKFDLNENKLIVGNLMNQDGTVAVKDQNKIIASVVNIQEERMLKGGGKVFGKGSFNEKGFFKPPIHLNLYVLFSAYFEAQLFNEGLKFLSLIVGFFQMNNVFTSVDNSLLIPDIEKLVFEMQNLSFQEQNNLWGALGCKYTPSVLYKIRMVTISELAMLQEGVEISEQSR